MARLEDLDLGGGVVDDRWTAEKLARAGYTHTGIRACRSCGERVEFYVREPRCGGKLWLILDEGSLAVHGLGCR